MPLVPHCLGNLEPSWILSIGIHLPFQAGELTHRRWYLNPLADVLRCGRRGNFMSRLQHYKENVYTYGQAQTVRIQPRTDRACNSFCFSPSYNAHHKAVMPLRTL